MGVLLLLLKAAEGDCCLTATPRPSLVLLLLRRRWDEEEVGEIGEAVGEAEEKLGYVVPHRQCQRISSVL